jgi:hypothetical protein
VSTRFLLNPRASDKIISTVISSTAQDNIYRLVLEASVGIHRFCSVYFFLFGRLHIFLICKV